MRDFFLATSVDELERSFADLAREVEAEPPAVEDWQEVEFALNRLFVGPAALEAPPYSSIYLDAQAQTMSGTTMDVRKMYGELGLESPWKNRLPDDHISLELDAALAIAHIAARADLEEIENLRVRFFNHMENWLPLFAARAIGAPSAHPAIVYVVQCLCDWLEEQTNDETTDYQSYSRGERV